MSTWTRTCIPSYLLTNERYVGDLLMRKYYTPPMLPLRAKKNRGEDDTFFKTNFTYKGAVCPIAERRPLSWWQENVNGPLEQVITAERRK